jgi:hypothetical protein
MKRCTGDPCNQATLFRVRLCGLFPAVECDWTAYPYLGFVVSCSGHVSRIRNHVICLNPNADSMVCMGLSEAALGILALWEKERDWIGGPSNAETMGDQTRDVWRRESQTAPEEMQVSAEDRIGEKSGEN